MGRVTQTLAALLFLLALAPGPVASAVAAPSAESCTEGSHTFSLMFLVDQSASMSGTVIAGKSIPASDPNQQRRFVPAYALSRVGEERLFSADHPVDSLGVVGFGDAAAVDLPMTAIAPDPKDVSAWETQRDQLVAQIKSDQRGDTNFLAAFQEAAKQFSAQQQGCSGKTGQKAIVVVTDGGPCVVADGCQADADFWPNDHAAMKQLLDYVLSKFSPADYRIWVLTLARPNAPDLERVRPEWEDLTRRYNGSLIPLANNGVDLADKVGGVLRELGLDRGQFPCGPNYIDPYTGHLSIWLLKPSPDTNVTITLPDQTRLDPKDPRVILHAPLGPNEEYVVRSPPPGQWNFSGCSGVTIYGEAFRAVARLRGPTGVTSAGDASGALEYSLTDANGDPIPANPKYPLDWNLQVEGPRGPLANPCAWRDGATAGVFACAPLPDAQPGRYTVRVTLQTKRADPYNSTPLVVAEDTGGHYDVTAAVTPTPAVPPTVTTSVGAGVIGPPTATQPTATVTSPLTPSAPLSPPEWAALGLLAIAAVAGIIWYVLQGQGPVGRLEFSGAEGGKRGELVLTGRPRRVALNARQCGERLPAVGLTALTVERGATARGATTVRLSLTALDGHTVQANFHDGDEDWVDNTFDCKVTYRGVATGTTTASTTSF